MVLGVAFENLAVGRIHLHRHIGVGHHRHAADGRVLHVHGHVFLADVDGLPLPGTRRAFLQLPLVAEQQLEVAVIPLRGVGGPRAFKTAGHGVSTVAGLGRIAPAEALFFHRAGLGVLTQLAGVAVAMGLTHRVATGG